MYVYIDMYICVYTHVFCLLQNNIHRFLQNRRCLSRNSIDDLIKISDRKKIASRFIKQQICAGQRCFTTEIKFLTANVSRIIRMNTFKVHGPARERSVHVYVTKNVKRGRNLDSPVNSMAVSVEEWKAGEENFRRRPHHVSIVVDGSDKSLLAKNVICISGNRDDRKADTRKSISKERINGQRDGQTLRDSYNLRDIRGKKNVQRTIENTFTRNVREGGFTEAFASPGH